MFLSSQQLQQFSLAPRVLSFGDYVSAQMTVLFFSLGHFRGCHANQSSSFAYIYHISKYDFMPRLF